MPTLYAQPSRAIFAQISFRLGDILEPEGADRPPVLSNDAKELVRVAERIVNEVRERQLRSPEHLKQPRVTSISASTEDTDVEPDLDEPITIAELAERQKRYLTLATHDWVDIDLPD